MRIEVHSPDAANVGVRVLVEEHGDGRPPTFHDVAMVRRGDGWWVAEVDDGVRYGLVAERTDGPTAPVRPTGRDRLLLDPSASAVWFPAAHDRDAARPGRPPNHDRAPLAVARRPLRVERAPNGGPGRDGTRPHVVHEAHVRGMTMRRDRPDAGTFRALVDELPRLAALGVTVLELLPVHQSDPQEGSYWGYMPLLFGAVEQRYAAAWHESGGTDHDAADRELAELTAAAAELGIEVWLDVVFNHTTEEDERGPTYHLRGLADRTSYVHDERGGYVDDAGCGNTTDVTTPAIQRLVRTALERGADLGVRGFRFDLATILSRDPAFVRSLGDWAAGRGVTLVAEAWDVVRYEVGRSWPDPRWKQWNDRFRDDMRGFLRGEEGLVGAVRERLQGSPDLFDRPLASVNFLTAHDGFTLYDLVAYDRKHNEANGHDGRDGADENRSWNCGWEGDAGVPDDVMELRRRQLRNAWTLLALSHGTPMFVAGDEFARTQLGNNNPYNQDNEISWIDWDRRAEWCALETFAQRLLAFRARHPILSAPDWWGADVEWFGVDGPPDLGAHSRSLAWHLPGLYVVANMWWEPLDATVQAPGAWRRTIDTSCTAGFVEEPEPIGPSALRVGPRSIVVLTADS